jgi:hypothetical protein
MFDEKRAQILQIARAELGAQDPAKYWADVCPAFVGTSKAWCGGFVLWVLHRAELAKDHMWRPSVGFVLPARLPRTLNPEPGDIAYFHEPLRHYAIVVSSTVDELVTIDGNQPGETVRERRHPRDVNCTVFSIEKFFREADTVG